jgi:hypothetical protein
MGSAIHRVYLPAIAGQLQFTLMDYKKAGSIDIRIVLCTAFLITLFS